MKKKHTKRPLFEYAGGSIGREAKRVAKNKPTPKIWESFLPLASSRTTDLAPAADAAWLMSKGCEAEAPALLVQLRDEVLPVVRKFKESTRLEWFSILVHDYASGVPTTKNDKCCYIHLRLKLREPVFREVVQRPKLPASWKFTRQVPLSREIAGVDPNVLDVDEAWKQLGAQSEWLLSFLEKCDKKADGLQLVRLVRQFLHFAANMTQMRVA